MRQLMLERLDTLAQFCKGRALLSPARAKIRERSWQVPGTRRAFRGPGESVQFLENGINRAPERFHPRLEIVNVRDDSLKQMLDMHRDLA